MLANPYPYKSLIISKMHEALRNPRYLHFWLDDFNIDVDKIAEQSEITTIDRTSIENYGQMFNEKVVGYMRADINRTKHNSISNVAAICFEQYSTIYARDLLKFFKMLFTEYKCQKINWRVSSISPYIKSYDKLSQRWGARKFGPFKKEFICRNGEIVDGFIYEITMEEFKNKLK